MERKTDARMIRTAAAPAWHAGRFSLAEGIVAGLGALTLGAEPGCSCAPTFSLCRWPCSPPLLTWPSTRRSSATPPSPLLLARFPAQWVRMLGWTAARPHIEWPAVALFAILFVWQFPHFMAISWLYRDDYARAGIRMLPVVQPDGWSTVAEALFFAVVMIPVSLAPWFLGVASE
jgi:protoheme IX farnesyltransferase